MDKVKIKRTNRHKKKVTTAEKILAGVGLTTTIFGGGGGASAAKPKTAMVSHSTKSNSKIKDTLKNIFGVQTAKADYTEGSIPTSQVTALTGGYMPPAVLYGGNLYEQNGENYQQTATGSQVTGLITSGGLTAGTIIVGKKVGMNDILSGRWIGRIIPKSTGGTTIASPSGAVQGQANVISSPYGTWSLEDAEFFMQNDPGLARDLGIELNLEQTDVVSPQGTRMSLGELLRNPDKASEWGFEPEMYTLATSVASSAAMGGLLASGATAGVATAANVTISFTGFAGTTTFIGTGVGAGTVIPVAPAIPGYGAAGLFASTPGAVVPGTTTVAANTSFLGSISNSVSGGLKAVSTALNTASKAVGNLFGLGATAGGLIIGAAIAGAIAGISHWRAVARNNMLKVADTKAIEAVNPQIFEIINIYNSNAGRTLEEETELYTLASNTALEIYMEAAAKFQRSQSLTSQNQYMQGMLDSMSQTYEQRKQAHLNELSVLEIFEQPDGTRGAYTGPWGMVVLKGDGMPLYVEKTNQDIPVSDSFLITILGKNNVTRVADIDFPGKDRSTDVSSGINNSIYTVYLTDSGKMVYIDGIGTVTIRDNQVFNDQGSVITLSDAVLNAINSAPVIDIRIAPPSATTKYTDEYILNNLNSLIYTSNEDISNTQLERVRGLISSLPNSVNPGTVLAFMLGLGNENQINGFEQNGSDGKTYVFNNGVWNLKTASQANTVAYDVFITDQGKGAWADGFGFIIIRSDRSVVNQEGTTVTGVPTSVIDGILNSNKITDLRTVTPPGSGSLVISNTASRELWRDPAGVTAGYFEEIGSKVYKLPSGILLEKRNDGSFVEMTTYNFSQENINKLNGILGKTASDSKVTIKQTPVNLYSEIPVFYSPGYGVNPVTVTTSVQNNTPTYTLPTGFVMPPGGFTAGTALPNGMVAGNTGKAVNPNNVQVVVPEQSVANATQLWQQSKAGQNATNANNHQNSEAPKTITQRLQSVNTVGRFGIDAKNIEYILINFPNSSRWENFKEWANSNRNTQFKISGTNNDTGENFSFTLNKSQGKNILEFLQG